MSRSGPRSAPSTCGHWKTRSGACFRGLPSCAPSCAPTPRPWGSTPTCWWTSTAPPRRTPSRPSPSRRRSPPAARAASARRGPSSGTGRRARPARRVRPGPVVLGAVVVGVLILFLVLGLVGNDDSSKSDQAAKSTETTTTPKRHTARPKPQAQAAALGRDPEDRAGRTHLRVPGHGAGQHPRLRGHPLQRAHVQERPPAAGQPGQAPGEDHRQRQGRDRPAQRRSRWASQVTKTGATEITNGPRPCA